MKITKYIAAVLASLCLLSLTACGSDTAQTTAAPETTTAAPETTVESLAPYKAGTYEASAQGFSSTVKVTVTIDEAGVITEVVIDASGETESLGGVAAKKLPDKILAAQSAEIDGVSGASMTSKAIIAALTEILEGAAN